MNETLCHAGASVRWSQASLSKKIDPTNYSRNTENPFINVSVNRFALRPDSSDHYCPNPQLVEPSGGHIGVGIALVFESAAVFVDAEEVWVEAATPVTTRARTIARIMVFMVSSPKVVFTT
jgi:hypothetical protein